MIICDVCERANRPHNSAIQKNLQIVADILCFAVIWQATLAYVVIPCDLVICANIKRGDCLTNGTVPLDEGIEVTIFRCMTPLTSVGKTLRRVVRNTRSFVVVGHTAVGVRVAAKNPRACWISDGTDV